MTSACEDDCAYIALAIASISAVRVEMLSKQREFNAAASQELLNLYRGKIEEVMKMRTAIIDEIERVDAGCLMRHDIDGFKHRMASADQAYISTLCSSVRREVEEDILSSHTLRVATHKKALEEGCQVEYRRFRDHLSETQQRLEAECQHVVNEFVINCEFDIQDSQALQVGHIHERMLMVLKATNRRYRELIAKTDPMMTDLLLADLTVQRKKILEDHVKEVKDHMKHCMDYAERFARRTLDGFKKKNLYAFSSGTYTSRRLPFFDHVYGDDEKQ